MRLTIKGFKGAGQVIQLGRFNLLTGGNGCGKSEVADSLRFGFLGWVPSLGRRLSDTAALLRGRDAVVQIDIDDLRSVRRELTRTEDGGYKSRVQCSWLQTSKMAEHETAILKLLGKESQDVEELLDVRALLSATPNARAARLQQLLSVTGYAPNVTAAAIARRTVQRLQGLEDDHMPADYRDIVRLIAERSPATVERLRALSEPLRKKLAETGIAGAIEWANAEKREAAARVKNQSAAVHEIRTRLAGLSAAAADEVERLEAHRDELHGWLGEAAERATAGTRQRQAITEARTALARAAATLETARGRVEAAQAQIVAPEVLAALVAELDALVAPESADPDTAQALLAEAGAREARISPGATEASVADLERRVAHLQAQVEGASHSPAERVRDIARELLEDAVGTSARVERLRRYATELLQVADTIMADPAVLAAEAQRAARDLLDAQDAAAAASDVRREVQRLRKAAEEMLITARTEATAAMVAYQARRHELMRERDRLQDVRTAQQDTQIAFARAEQAHAAALQRAADLPDLPETATDTQAELRAELEQVQGRLTAHGQARAKRDELTAIVAELEQATVTRDVFTALEDAARAVAAEQTTAAGGPLVQHMRRFLQAAGRTEEPFFHAEHGVCDIGWRTVEGDDVLVQVLSGGEYTLFTTALLAAMTTLRAAPVRVLLVEAAELDERAFLGLLAGIEAVGDELTTALVMRPDRPAEIPAAWQVIEMGAAQQEVAA